MKRAFVIVAAALAFAVPASAARVPVPILPPVEIALNPVCVQYALTHHLPILYCVGR